MAAARTTLGINARAPAAALEAARRDRRPIAPPRELATCTLAEAYEIQDAVVACRESAGVVRSGWKLGLTSAVKARIMGIERPVFGRLFADGSIASGSSIPRAAFIAPRTEPELALGLARALDPAADWAALLAAVAWVAPALEITDSRYEAGKRTALELVADNTSAAAYVIGMHVALAAAPQIECIETALVRNAIALATGRTADVLGNPLVALTLLARHLAERGLGTVAGDIVLSGAITDAVSVAAGDRIEARLDGLGTVAVDFV